MRDALSTSRRAASEKLAAAKYKSDKLMNTGKLFIFAYRARDQLAGGDKISIGLNRVVFQPFSITMRVMQAFEKSRDSRNSDQR